MAREGVADRKRISVDEFEHMERKVSGSNPLVLKLIAMKMRHRAAGLVFKKKQESDLTVPLASNHTDRSSATSVPRSTITADGRFIEVHGPDNWEGLKTIFLHPFCILLVFVPLGMLSYFLDWGDSWTFWLNFMALVPLAKVLGDATEELAASIGNDTVSGLLNASFGNAVEMIISVQTLRAGLLDVVKATLLGSILSNILLVLGTSLFLGGLTAPDTRSGRCHEIEDRSYELRRAPTFGEDGEPQRRKGLTLDLTIEKEQKFPVKSAQVCMGMLLLACMSVILPTIFDIYPDDDTEKVLEVSRIGACIVGSSYIAFLVFQLLTHTQTLSKDEQLGAETPAGQEEDAPGLSTGCSIVLMLVVTVVVAASSEFLVDAIESVVKGAGIPEMFIGTILLPIAGNACEHASAIRFAMQDRPGLSIGISVGSSTQIALLVIPFTVICGWIMGQPMDLNFGVMNCAVMILSVLVVLVLVQDGRSNWLKGYMMVAAYALISVLYWFVPPPVQHVQP